TTDAANTGEITVTREAQMRRQDYVYWGSPVTGQNLQTFSPATLSNRFYTMDEPTNAFVAINPALTDFVPGNGYMVRAPNNFPVGNPGPVTTFEGKFTGVPNNGPYNVPVTVNSQGFNMLANPYPSPISVSSFLASQPTTLYFW